jgi:hypothetical protein
MRERERVVGRALIFLIQGFKGGYLYLPWFLDLGEHLMQAMMMPGVSTVG